ncbi:MAG: formylglycine-generating enzyme family protein [Anaerolineales bacterium]|nr:formylglycine-generating enzyme family protein [Anaerolineales bacterium]
MKYPPPSTTRLLLTVLIIAVLLSGCALGDLFKPRPQLDDTRQRQADGMVMVFVPKGEFSMGIDVDGMHFALQLCKTARLEMGPACLGTSYGDEMPVHPVKLDAFWIDQTEVTNQGYLGCVEDQVCSLPSDLGSFTREKYFGDSFYADYPVVWITRDQAVEYCSWAGGRLPTEAEWEYAARGPESRTFPWGEEFESSRANYCDASCAAGVFDPSYDDGFPETAPVGSFPTGMSWCGALDMAGNVREWVADWFYYYSADPQTNPVGPVDGDKHTAKGGCWLDSPENLRASNRGQNTRDYTRHKVGFRCVMDLD